MAMGKTMKRFMSKSPSSAALHVSVPCDLSFCRPTCAMIETLCRTLDETTRYHVLSAFMEAFNNIVKHSELSSTEPIEISVTLDDKQLSVSLSDRGKPNPYCDASTLPQIDPLDLPESGMGLLIIHRCMDEVTYDSSDKNRLLMVRHLARFDEER